MNPAFPRLFSPSRLVLALVLGVLWSATRASAMPAPGDGRLEAGSPSFAVLGADALGLSSLPIDLHVMPDGRILVVSQHELAIGDGVRWETFRGADDQPAIFAGVCVDEDGGIYTGRENRVCRFEFTANGLWVLRPTVELPATGTSGNPTLISAAALPEGWYWHGGSGAVVRWRPGSTAALVGRIGFGEAGFGGGFTIDEIFALGGDRYVSDQTSGGLLRLKGDAPAEQVAGVRAVVSESVTCTIPFAAGQLLVGTVNGGLKLFDGTAYHDFASAGLLKARHGITDVCAAGSQYFAAAIDGFGIVFFDRQGHTIQTLDHSLDHRLARARRLKYAEPGVLWALLDDALVRVQFPSPISYFEPQLSSRLAFAQPLRHAGQLWVLADGRAMRGVYDAERLVRFEDATPSGQYLFTLDAVDGRLFAASGDGIYVYEETNWRQLATGVRNARIGVGRGSAQAIYFVARGEYGIIHVDGASLTLQRFPAPDLTDSFSAVVDAKGVGWLELGVSRVARMEPRGDQPSLRIFGSKDGLLDGWVELYLLDGVARFHMTDRVFRFDDRRDRFVEDSELLARLPPLASATGRPTTDSRGRIWYTATGTTQVLAPAGAGRLPPVKIPPVGFAPTIYTAQDDGVMWMFEKRRLARMDLRVPLPSDAPVPVLITSLVFPSSGRQLFKPGSRLAPVGFDENSVRFNFLAPRNPFGAAVTFEVKLEGAGDHWISTGSIGAATFNRLREGDYVFRVRTVSGGTVRGTEAALAFTIHPPWYRTLWAYALYGCGTLGVFAFGTWLTSYLQRRENRRLERLVALRTTELNDSNAQLRTQIDETRQTSAALMVSEGRYRLLNTELEERVTRRTAELSESNAELQQRELLFRLIFEHAPVGISWKRTDLGDLCHINSAFRRILNLTTDTLGDYRGLVTLVHPEDAAQLAEQSRRIETGEIDSYTHELRFVPGGDRLVWGLLSAAVVRNDSGRIIQEIGILEDITDRKRAEAELAVTHRNLLLASRHAGMAEVATGILHNVGNVLNSVNISATLVTDRVRASKAVNVAKIACLLEQHRERLTEFLTQDPRGRTIPDFLCSLGNVLNTEQEETLKELNLLQTNVDHIKEVVAMQQSYAQVSGFLETVSVPDLVEDALRINAGSLERHQVGITRDYQARPVITTDKHKVLQILINLVRNAKYACDESGRTDKSITIRTSEVEHGVRIAVIDNGVGIPRENLTQIFNYGFTTRRNGHGFGLHSGALAAKEIGGSLVAHSEGPGYGATFILELPLKSKLIRS